MMARDIKEDPDIELELVAFGANLWSVVG